MKNKNKTIREWLNELPDGYREAALSENPFWNWDKSKVSCMSIAITMFAIWRESEFGTDFWEECRNYFVALEKDLIPKLPKLPKERFTMKYPSSANGYSKTWELYYKGSVIATSMPHTFVFKDEKEAEENAQLFLAKVKNNIKHFDFEIDFICTFVSGKYEYVWELIGVDVYAISSFHYSSRKTAKKGLDRFLKLFGHSIKDIKEYGDKTK
jgi:hypothetical protein